MFEDGFGMFVGPFEDVLRMFLGCFEDGFGTF